MNESLRPIGPSQRFERLVRLLQEREPVEIPPVEEQRRILDAAADGMPMAPDVVVWADNVGGVPVEWSGRRRDSASERTIVYVHGGGFSLGSPATARPLATFLGSAAGADVCSVDYRLAPEHPYPAAVEDVVAVYEALIAAGRRAAAITLAGDSSGGNVVVAAALRLLHDGCPPPSALVLFGPWLDLDVADDDTLDDPRDPQVNGHKLHRMASNYRASWPVDDPGVSPVHADPTGLPPILIQVGGVERLRRDSERFAAAAMAAGVDVTLRVWDGMFHVWQAFVPGLAEALDAVHEAGAWLTARP